MCTVEGVETRTNLTKEATFADNFREKFNLFLVNTQSVSEQKLPAWFRPFMETVKEISVNVTDAFEQLCRKQVDLEARLGVQKAVTDALEIDRERVANDLLQVTTDLEDLKQYSRRNQILVHGVEEQDKSEDCDDSVLKIFGEMELPISKADINRCHRLGRRKDGQVKKRPIIVSFCSYRNKKLAFDNKKKLKGRKLGITESLTRTRYMLLQKCFETYGKENCWTLDGRIYIVQDGHKFCVTSEEDLAEGME